jgi:hypothetical protein
LIDSGPKSQTGEKGFGQMKRIIFIVSAVCAAGLIAIIVGSHAVSAQNENPGKGDSHAS